MEDKKKISRKEALNKLGDYSKFTALTAMGTLMILNPQKAQAQSYPDNPGGGFGFERFNENMTGSPIWNPDSRYNRYKNEGFRVPFSNDAQYGPFQNNRGGVQIQGGSNGLTPFQGQRGSAPASHPIWK